MEPVPGTAVRTSRRYALTAEIDTTYCAVEGIRLRADEIDVALAEVDAFMAETRTRVASWWLTERSEPDDVEELLLRAGCTVVESDYLHAALLLTRAPPDVPTVEARVVASFDEYAEARRLQRAVFADPNHTELTDEQLRREYELDVSPVFAAWIDGRLAAAGRGVFTRAGCYLMGGATAEWARGRGAYRAVVRARWDAAVERGTPALAVGAGAMSRPILERLGFRQVAQFRRLQSVRS
jgi:hypothetical protein